MFKPYRHSVLLIFIGGIDFTEIEKRIGFQSGINVRGCGCIGIINDPVLNVPKEFGVIAAINDPVLNSTGTLSTSVMITPDTIDSQSLMNSCRYCIKPSTFCSNCSCHYWIFASKQ